MVTSDTIAAPATPPGRGGVGMIRISGSLVPSIAQTILKKNLKARRASFCNFSSVNGKIIDQGLALYFCAPHSFTGEDVLELHCHGGVGSAHG
jgi:tRNA modification GTPase